MITWVVWHWVPGRKVPRGQGWNMDACGSREMEVSVLGTVHAPDRAHAQWAASRQYPHLRELHVQSQTSFDLNAQESRATAARARWKASPGRPERR